jgi:hypothetical protein
MRERLQISFTSATLAALRPGPRLDERGAIGAQCLYAHQIEGRLISTAVKISIEVLHRTKNEVRAVFLSVERDLSEVV